MKRGNIWTGIWIHAKPVQCGGFADITPWPLILRRYYEATTSPFSALKIPHGQGQHTAGSGSNLEGWSTPLSCSSANVHHEFLCSWHVKHDSNILGPV
ncbi:hypothetical protein GQ55_7G127100 [Panicum hallii var. hallii]|uniref:Uncharacterized protein n=1 Tax=Panicum hallii var. hallii TaxID=1504633 RepID=A0A2T7CUH2_9POAL|nr:hypothetical protein GQ55_7G127100 [Panicum hallii var. hallii]